MKRRKSITLRAAALTSVLSFVLLLCVSVGFFLIQRNQQSREEVAEGIVAAIADAVTRDANGSLRIDKTPALEAFERHYPSLWYAVADGDQVVTGGPQAAQPSPNADQQEPVYFMTFQLRIGKVTTDGLSATRETPVGPVSIQLAGLPEERLPLAVEALAASAMFSAPLLVILVTAGLAGLAVMPRLIARPVRETSIAAEAIDGVPNGRRLPEDEAPPELRPLVAAFNRALERIDLAAEAQRAFLANAAHELRTPLARLRSHLDEVPPGDARSKLIGDLHRLSDTVTMLLQLARLTGEPQKFDIVDLVSLAREVVADEVPAALAERMEIEFSADDEPVLIKGVVTAIRTALANVVRNAVRHSGSCEPIIVTVTSPGIIRVIDHGRGIPDGMRAEILKPFERGQAMREGVGLGLAIVAQITALHNGRIVVGETPGGGATFELYFVPDIHKARTDRALPSAASAGPADLRIVQAP